MVGGISILYDLLFIYCVTIKVIPVSTECYYDFDYNYYDCYTNVSVIIGAVIGSIFGFAILVVIVIICCSQIKTTGNRGHVVRPSNISTVHTGQQNQCQQPQSLNGYNQYSSPGVAVYQQQGGTVYPPPQNNYYPPSKHIYGPPPDYTE